MDWDHTLNLPKTSFPMKAELVKREPQFQRFWQEQDIYHKALEKPAPRGLFILHDGPPYSNGDIHMGHALNKTLKDIIVKFRMLQGYRSPFVPGWDNHGMPIENEVTKEFRRKGEKPDKVTLRKRCREYAAHFVNRQREQFQRLGCIGDWKNPYLTMSYEFEATLVRVFGELVERGYIYRGLKPVLWCPVCETALADAEIEYHTHTSPSITVRFALKEDPGGVFPAEDGKQAYILIWTTTPWTIPSNLAVAVHPAEPYAIVETDGAQYLLAEALVESTMSRIGAKEYRVVRTVPGNQLSGLVFQHPLYGRESPVVFADYVTMTEGTGVVHIAPGHGEEDFHTGQEYGLQVLCPVDVQGKFTAEVGERIAGKYVRDADAEIIEWLREQGALMAHEPYEHQYPYCWRCHSPLLFRATVQWFMNIDHKNHRQRCLEAIDRVKWFPPQSINRIRSMVQGRPHWCLSRQRAWGVGIPAFYCKACGEVLLEPALIARIADEVEKAGSDVWFEKPAEFFLPEGIRCPKCGNTTFDKEDDILDVWFDSGCTHRAVLEKRPELRWPSDVYLEGSDQHRGWFNSSLMIAVATKDDAPYRAVITNGWMLDGEGRAMHKSWGNVISPLEVINKYGADVLRLWVSSCNYFEDVRLSFEILDRTAEAYRRIRNTIRFLLGNLYDYDPAQHRVVESQMLPLDQWAMARTRKLLADCVAAYEVYEFHRVYQNVHNFCVVDMSAFYLDVLKDRLYCSPPTSHERRSAQTVLHFIAQTLAQLLAPIITHTAEEVWQALPGENKALSVLLSQLPEDPFSVHDDAMLERWEPVLAVRETVNKAMEQARQSEMIRRSQEAALHIKMDDETWSALKPFFADLSTLYMVSSVEVEQWDEEEVSVTVRKAEGEKCPRCWQIRTDIGTDAEYPDLCARCAAAVRAIG